MAPLRRPASHTTQTLLKSASYILSPLHSASALLPAPSPPPPPQTTPTCLPAPAFNPPHLHSHSSCIPYIYATSTAFRVFRVCVAAWLMGVVCQTASCCSKRIANERPTIPAHFAALSTLLSGVIRSKLWCNAEHPTFLPLSLLAGMRLAQAHTHSASHAARHLLQP